ncbi:MAG: TonB-dependent receptor [Rhodothermales bacterium]|nr:TonB-dependent receptor [Rhodothermales bacterium]
MRALRRLALCGLAFLFALAPSAFAQTGTLAGTVVDRETGETLIGVNVLIESLGTGAATGIDGDYRIAGLEPGAYDVRFSYLGYQTQVVTGVEVNAGETKRVDVALGTEALDLADGEEVVVEAEVLRDSEVGLLIERQKAAGVSDAISAETISRAGASTAADALQKVPGASVVGGKYLVVRGLSDRYLNTQLNGATLPSADPERQAAPLDLFPSGLLENIVTSKSFTPDQPGDFTGGAVNISTRSFPEQLTAQVSTSVGFNTAVEPGADYLRYAGGGVSVFGEPEGSLALPSLVEGLGPRQISEAPQDQRAAITNAFGSTFAPQVQDAPVNSSFSASLGNQTRLFGRPFGFLLGTNWSRSVDGYAGGVNSEIGGAAGNLSEDYRLETREGEEEVLLGGLANFNYRPTDRSELGLNLLFNKNATSTAIFQTGLFTDGTLQEADNVYEGRALFFTERALFSSQLRGKHALTEGGVRAEWNAAYSRTTLDEPDYRIFQNEVDTNPSMGGTDYLIRSSAYDSPSRTYRDLEEDGLNGSLDLEVPLGRRAGLPIALKVGGAMDYRARTFRERTFLYPIRTTNQRLLNEFGGDPNLLIANAAEAGLFIDDQTDLDAAYDGELQVYAGYGMVDLALVERLRFVGGVRYEYTDLSVSSPRGTFRADPDGEAGYTAGGLDDALLPAASLVYSLTDAMNLRAAYGKTLARPTFREVAPRGVFSLAERYTINGNPEIEQSSVHNADLRWEWFVRPGEILAASAFYKRFIDPIELTIVTTNNQLRPDNLGEADLYGLEFEARRRLDFLPGPLANLQAGGNLSLVDAEIELTRAEREARGVCAPADEVCPTETRPLEGQSPFVLNLDLGYLDLERGTSVNLFFNAFGRRLYAVSTGITPDLYEESRATLDLTARQDIWGGLALKFSAKNLLGESYRLAYYDEDTAEDFLRREYDLGRSFSFGISYSL